MEWRGERESENVEDRRALNPGTMAAGGGIGALLLGLVIYFLTGHAPSGLGGGSPTPAYDAKSEEERVHFVKVVLASTEDVWTRIFRDEWKATYRKPKLVLFRGAVDSACGRATASVGPFYCPGDDQVYLDLSFFKELEVRFQAPGEFAQAYVIAHEVGHHVQNLRGVSARVSEQQRRYGRNNPEANRLSVRLELQADFYAGVWGHYAKNQFKLRSEDLETAIKAAQAIGDDRLQKQARGYVVPDSFTHGTSAQRVRWFRLGFETGDVNKGDTFSIPYEDL
jgi:predicted metalloprotease